MDDRRFDSITKALATGKNRRSVLKGLLGLGGAALGSGVLLESEVDAARRPAPTPKPPSCPGQQVRSGNTCVCPNGLSKCGPDCCNPTEFPSTERSECCDNACCFGTCYGEELCCPTNVQQIDGHPYPPTHKVCEVNDGSLCCPFWDDCCAVDGCCDTICTGGMSGIDHCCSAENFCPNLNTMYNQCCTGDTICCGANTGESACVDPSTGGCCNDSDCGDPCQICNQQTSTCEARCDSETEVCCTEQVGPGVCVTGVCCLGALCAEGAICCQGEGETVCVEGETCPSSCSVDSDCQGCEHCDGGWCAEGCSDGLTCCDEQCLPADQICSGGTCCAGGFCDGNGDCCPSPNIGCNSGTCCDGFCDGNGDCCASPNVGCNDGFCCSETCDQNGNCPNTCQAACWQACGTVGDCDCGGCPEGKFCAPEGYCCPGEAGNQNCGGCGNFCDSGRSCENDQCILDQCVGVGSACIYDPDCCHGSCQDSVCACQAVGQSCATDSDCCSDLCYDNQCDYN